MKKNLQLLIILLVASMSLIIVVLLYLLVKQSGQNFSQPNIDSSQSRSKVATTSSLVEINAKPVSLLEINQKKDCISDSKEYLDDIRNENKSLSNMVRYEFGQAKFVNSLESCIVYYEQIFTAQKEGEPYGIVSGAVEDIYTGKKLSRWSAEYPFSGEIKETSELNKTEVMEYYNNLQ